MATDYDRIRADHVREYGEGTRHLAFLGRLYPDRTHFLFELLQNAEDARATRLHFDLCPDRLEVRHDGRPFDAQDVRAICGVAAAAKAEDPTQIGKFGIGFKSVYAYTAEPEIHSGDEHFRIESYVRPHAVPSRGGPPAETRFLLPFSHADVPATQAAAEIGARLQRLEATTTLFLRSIGRITWRTPDGVEGSIERREDPWGPARRLTLTDRRAGTETETEWLVFSDTGASPVPLARRVQLAVRVARDLPDGRPRVVPLSHAPLVVVFPTEKDTHLGLLIEGPYRTTPARDNVPSDDPWNRRLVTDTAALLAEALPALRDLGLMSRGLLETLPIREADFAPDSLLRALFDRVRDTLRRNPLLPAADGGYVEAAAATLPAGPAIAALLSDAQLGDLLAERGGVRWLAADIAGAPGDELRTYLRTQLGIDEVTPDTLALRIDERFMARQPDAWVARLYGFLGAHPALWQAATGVWGDRDGPLRAAAWLRLEDGRHVAPFQADGTPTAYLPPAEPTDYPVVTRAIAAEPHAREFLLRLGLREPDVGAEVLDRVLPKYASGTTAPPAPEEHRRDLEKIFRALAADSEAQRARLIDRVRRTPCLRVRNAATGADALARPTSAYRPRSELERYFAGNPSAWFVAEPMDDLGTREQWEALGVADLPRRLADDLALSAEDKRALRARQRAGWTGDRDATDFELDGLAHFFDRFPANDPAAALEHALALWALLTEHVDRWPSGNPQRLFEGEYRWYYHGEEAAAYFPAAFVARLRAAAWLPGGDGVFRRPGERSLKDLPDRFARDETVALALGMRLDEFDAFALRHGIAPDLLRFTVEHADAVEALRTSHPAGRADRATQAVADEPAQEPLERIGAPDDWAPHWSLDPTVTFLNHGSFGACPIAVLEEQQRLRVRLEREPVEFFLREFEPLLDAARGELAAFVGAAAEDLVFVPNATAGVNAVLRSLRFAPDDELLVTDHAYGACRNALEFVARRAGARVIVAEVPFPIDDPAHVVDCVRRRVTARTRLALLDHVASPTGLVFPIAPLVAELAERGIDTLVDGAHAAGMLPLCLADLGAAYYAGHCHKWLCAPKGAAFLHVRRDRQGDIHPLAISHGATATRTDRSRFLLEFGWTGTSDPTPCLCVPAALRLLGRLLPGGWPALMERNHALAVAARRRLCDVLGIAPPCPDDMIGALVALPVADATGDAAAAGTIDPLQDALLDEYGIQVPIMSWPAFPKRLVRVSLHAYNTAAQVDRLAEALREQLAPPRRAPATLRRPIEPEF